MPSSSPPDPPAGRSSGQFRRCARLACTCVGIVLALFTSADASAQRVPVVLQILVLDGATGEPIPGAQVVVNGGRTGTVSGQDGMADLPADADDSLQLEVRMLGYATRSLSARPTTGQSLLLTIPLEPEPIPLEPVRIEVEGAPRSRQLRDFYARTRGGAGQFLTRADIERRRPRDLSDLFRMLPGIPLIATPMGDKPAMEGKASAVPSLGSREADCAIQYFLDGTPIQPSNGVVGLDVSLREIEGIEIYRRATGVPAKYQRRNNSCGVILIWRRERLDPFGER